MASLPGLWWPLVALVAILIFRREIPALLRRVRKWSGFGNTVELDPVEIAEANRELQQAESSA